jgi:galactoside O-acetyltransferase
MGFLSELELSKIKGQIGDNVLISDKCSLYTNNLIIGDNVRIDDFCILSGRIALGSNIHIGAYCGLYGKEGIIMEDFTGLSPRCTIFSASDDFSGDFLISPMTPSEYTNVTGDRVIMRMYSQLGSGCIIMPGVVISEGAAVGAMSFVKKDIPSFEIWAGNPAKFIKQRSKELIKLAYNYRHGL